MNEMIRKKVAEQYLERLNALNAEYGMSVIHTPDLGYVVEDQDNYDFMPVDLTHEEGTMVNAAGDRVNTCIGRAIFTLKED